MPSLFALYQREQDFHFKECIEAILKPHSTNKDFFEHNSTRYFIRVILMSFKSSD